jgi:CDP-glycerol glycerophosphotransferase (TagB/SpsB family)
VQQLQEFLKEYKVLFSVLKKAKSGLQLSIGWLLVVPLKIVDFFFQKSNNIWILPVHFYTYSFSDNARAVYEEIKNDEKIKKIILTRGIDIPSELISNSTKTVPMFSLMGFFYFLRAKVVFVQHSVWLDFNPLHFFTYLPFSLRRRRIVNLWHGIPIKSITAESTGISNRIMDKEKIRYIIPSSSENDRVIYATAFYPVKPQNILVTGIPRNDFLLMDEKSLPIDYTSTIKQIRAIKKDKKLIIYAPTYREIVHGGKCYEFTENEINQLKEFLIRNNARLGIRLHYYNRTLSYEALFDNEYFFDFDQSKFPDMAMIIRESNVVISDYSGLVVDCIYNNTPLINFVYDYDHYQQYQRGFSFPLEIISPLPLVFNFEGLINLMEKAVNDDETIRYKNKMIGKLFFKYKDSKNSARIIEKVKNMI